MLWRGARGKQQGVPGWLVEKVSTGSSRSEQRRGIGTGRLFVHGRGVDEAKME